MCQSIVLRLLQVALLFCAVPAHAQKNVVVDPSAKYADEYRVSNDDAFIAVLSEMASRIDPSLTIKFTECGRVNAFYTPASKTVTMCYELSDRISQVLNQKYSTQPSNVRSTLIGGANFFILLHELGHALIDLKEIPVIGGEEDAADRMAAVFLLSSNNGSNNKSQTKLAIQGASTFFWQSKRGVIEKIFPTQNYFADEHLLDEQRTYNLVCLAYGSNQDLYSDVARAYKIPDARLRRCREEYADANQSVSKLLSGTGLTGSTNTSRSKPESDLILEKVRNGNASQGSGHIRAPDQAENGSIVPVEITLTTPIRQGQCLYLFEDEQYLSHKTCPTGRTTLKALSVRVKAHTSGKILAVVTDEAGNAQYLQRPIQITGYKNGAQEGNPPLGAKHKSWRKYGEVEIKMLAVSPMTQENYIAKASFGFGAEGEINMDMTPQASMNPFVGLTLGTFGWPANYTAVITSSLGERHSENVTIETRY